MRGNVFLSLVFVPFQSSGKGCLEGDRRDGSKGGCSRRNLSRHASRWTLSGWILSTQCPTCYGIRYIVEPSLHPRNVSATSESSSCHASPFLFPNPHTSLIEILLPTYVDPSVLSSGYGFCHYSKSTHSLPGLFLARSLQVRVSTSMSATHCYTVSSHVLCFNIRPPPLYQMAHLAETHVTIATRSRASCQQDIMRKRTHFFQIIKAFQSVNSMNCQ